VSQYLSGTVGSALKTVRKDLWVRVPRPPLWAQLPLALPGRRHSGSKNGALEKISRLQEVGSTISEIGELIRKKGPRKRWRSLGQDKLEEIDTHLERIVAARICSQLLLSAGARDWTPASLSQNGAGLSAA